MEPKGIRNKNPGNIEYNTQAKKWQGLDDPPFDGRFCRFKTPVYGIRALAKTLITYYDKYGLNTVAQIIDRWAPPEENDTRKYAEFVAKRVGVHANDEIDLHQYEFLRPLVEAIIQYENGKQPYSGAVIDKGLVMTGVEPPAKPITKTRTIQAGQVAAGATVTAVVAESVEKLEPTLPFLQLIAEYAPLVFGVMALLGIGYMIYARIDDHRKGLR